jgi:hypothetical protein
MCSAGTLTAAMPSLTLASDAPSAAFTALSSLKAEDTRDAADDETADLERYAKLPILKSLTCEDAREKRGFA